MKIFLYITFLLTCLPAFGQMEGASRLQRRLVIAGAGEQSGEHLAPLIYSIQKTIPIDTQTSVLVPGNAAAFARSDAAAFRDRGAGLLFLPGEQDWNGGRRGGLDSLLRLQALLEERYGAEDILQPPDGCPGPEEVKLGDDAVLVLLNTQWWLHPYEKPGMESDCPVRSRAQLLDELDGVLRDHEDKLVIVAGHHPLESRGIKGNHFTVKQHLFPLTDLHPSLWLPLPLVGSLYPVIGNAFPSRQEAKHPVYEEMSGELEEVLASHPHVLYISGHEQNLQLLRSGGLIHLNSGAAGTARRVSKGRETLFAHRGPGFAVVEVYDDKRVKILFYTTAKDGAHLAWSGQVMDFSRRPPLPGATTEDRERPAGDPVTVAASRKYEAPSKLREKLLGKNYRTVWSTPVKLPVFDLESQDGGYAIRKIGGGKQTKTLHLEDSSGHHYKLRTIDKDPKEFLPPELRSTLTQAIVNDLISAAHPYAPLVVAGLARRMGVVEAVPRYFYVPNDTAFGYYRPLFAGRVVMLVDKDPPPFADTKNSYDILNKTTEKADHVVDQRAVLRARLLDILTGDFDRHLGQWSWGQRDTGKGKLYEPVPKDRDQAFFLSDGWLVRLAARGGLSLFKGFHARIDNIEGLGFSAEAFDRSFLTGLDRRAWTAVIDSVRQALSDTAIDEAVRRLPPEIYALSGAEISRKLKSRRDDLSAEGLKYYDFLADEVNVLGSNERDYFLVRGEGAGLRVEVLELRGGTVMPTYSRLFDPAETKEVRLYGLNGEDYFHLDSSAGSAIRLRLIGGGGRDTFAVQGKAKTYVYDRRTEGNVLYRGARTRNRQSEAPGVNEYGLNSFAYRDKGGFPRLSLAASSEYGPLLGVGWVKKTYAFRKEPFATAHTLTGYYAPFRSSYALRYEGVLPALWGDVGLAATAEVRQAAVMNFYGLGNDTRWEPGRDASYYRIRYNYVAADLLLTQSRFGRLHLAAGPSWFRYWNHQRGNGGKILEAPGRTGLDSLAVYEAKTYLGGKARLEVNALPSLQFPTQGLQWSNELTYLQRVDGDRSLLSLRSDLLLAAPLVDTSKLIALVRVGGGHIFSNRFEYFQAVGFGSDHTLRGFRNNRFLGRSAAYGSLELRYRLLRVRSFTVPGQLGLLGFGHVGRVWMEGANTPAWHPAVGGGLYFYPFDRLLLTASAGRNEDGAIFNFSIGSTINWYQ